MRNANGLGSLVTKYETDRNDRKNDRNCLLSCHRFKQMGGFWWGNQAMIQTVFSGSTAAGRDERNSGLLHYGHVCLALLLLFNGQVEL